MSSESQSLNLKWNETFTILIHTLDAQPANSQVENIILNSMHVLNIFLLINFIVLETLVKLGWEEAFLPNEFDMEALRILEIGFKTITYNFV